MKASPKLQQVHSSSPVRAGQGAPVVAGGLPVGGQRVSLDALAYPAAPHKEYRCRVCKCVSFMRTHCGICGRRACMDEVPVVLPAGPAGIPEPEVVRRGNLALAVSEGQKIVRTKTGIPKLDRVLGGGYVDKTGILIAGDPGAGKSTLLMQACIAFAGHAPPKLRKGEKVDPEAPKGEPRRVLYCSGEESLAQVGARAGRLPGLADKGEYVEIYSTRSVPELMGEILDLKPHLVVVDSIQEIGDEALSGRFGGENQVSNCIRSIMKCLYENGHGTAFFVGHIKKDGDIAGCKKAEHLVDVVMQLTIALRDDDGDEEEDLAEDEKTVHDERFLEAHKNRYGSITDRAVFTMSATGMH